MRSQWPDRFWQKVAVGGEDACWPWTGGRAHGWPAVWDVSTQAYANSKRVAYALVNGPVAADAYIIATCGNTLCCNPRHLRAAAGPQAKLTQAAVDDIRRRYWEDPHVTQRALAQEYGVSVATICNVINAYTWKEAAR